MTTFTNSDQVAIEGRINFDVNLYPSNYKNYSIFSFPTNSSDIAVSENPIGIVENILEQSSFSFVAAQSSLSQTLTTSLQFQCYFGEQEEVQDILKEFGEISNTYMWIGDSGSLNMRTYQDSAAVTTDLTIGLNDMLDGQFSLLENPLGTTKYKSQKGNNVTINYNFDFQKNKYISSINAFKGNNSFCDSADASGLRKSIRRSTKYILQTDTASFYSSTIVRKVTQAEEFVNMTLPAKFFNLELADVVRVQHPMIVGSESLYQIVQLEQDLQNAKVSIVAQELLDLDL